MKTFGYCIALIISLGTAAPAWSQVSTSVLATDIFLQLRDIPGESQVRGYEDWIVVLSYDHALTNSIDFRGGGEVSVVSHTPIVLRKFLDTSSPALVDHTNKGMFMPEAVMDFVAPLAMFPYLKVELEEVYVVSYSLSVSADDERPIEEVALVYAKIWFTYRPTNPDGSPGEEIRVGWDVKGNTGLSIEEGSIGYEVYGTEVVFTWRTTSEAGYYGFELQLLEEDGFRRAAYVPASGWSSQPLEYEVRIRGLEDGVYVFRLAGLAVGGTVTYSEEFAVTVGDVGQFSLRMDPPYPNPISSRANLSVSVERVEDARVSVWDMLGREVQVLHDGVLRPGFKSNFVFEPAPTLPSGVYVVRAAAGSATAARLVTVIR